MLLRIFLTEEGLLRNSLVLVKLRVDCWAGELIGDWSAGEGGAEVDGDMWMVWLWMEFSAWGCGLREV